MTGDRDGREALHNGFDLSGLSLEDLWIRYVALGGNMTADELGTYVGDAAGGVLDRQHNVVVHAINERFMEMDLDHPVPYDEPPS